MTIKRFTISYSKVWNLKRKARSMPQFQLPGKLQDFPCKLFVVILQPYNFSEYASAVVEKLSTMVSSSQTDYLTKLRVINIMANFKENFEVTKKCMALSNELLCENLDNSLRAAILMALTNLAYRSSLGVSEQVSL